MSIKIKIALFFTILLGFIIRIHALADIPPGFFADEASIGYNAYTILTRGTDEYGIPFPFFFRAFGEYKSPIQIYSTVPFIAIFGLNEFATRLPAVLYGTASIFAIYLLTNELLPKYPYRKPVALIAALFLAISPWHVHISRMAFEQTPFVFFTILACYYFYSSLRKPTLLFFSIILFVLAIYSYYPARIFITFFVLIILFLYVRFFLQNKKIVFIACIFAAILLFPLVRHHLSSEGFSRWQQVSIFAKPPQNETVMKHVIDNYVSHFSFEFLFLKGDIDMPGQFITRHSVRGIGELYLLQLPLLILGFFYLGRIDKRIRAVLVAWLLLYPTGSMFTMDTSAQATRSIIGVVPFQLLSAFGIGLLSTFFSKHHRLLRSIIMVVFIVVIAISIFRFRTLYFEEYPRYAADFWGWQYGARDIVAFFKTQNEKYDDLVMAPEFNAPEIFLKFYAPNGCLNCQVGLPDNMYSSKRKQLFAVTPTYLANNQTLNFTIIKSIYYPNDTIAFQIGEIVE